MPDGTSGESAQEQEDSNYSKDNAPDEQDNPPNTQNYLFIGAFVGVMANSILVYKIRKVKKT